MGLLKSSPSSTLYRQSAGQQGNLPVEPNNSFIEVDRLRFPGVIPQTTILLLISDTAIAVRRDVFIGHQAIKSLTIMPHSGIAPLLPDLQDFLLGTTCGVLRKNRQSSCNHQAEKSHRFSLLLGRLYAHSRRSAMIHGQLPALCACCGVFLKETARRRSLRMAAGGSAGAVTGESCTT